MTVLAVYTRDCIRCVHQGPYLLCSPGNVFAVYTRDCIRCLHQGLYMPFTPGTLYAVYTRDFIRCLHHLHRRLLAMFTQETYTLYTMDCIQCLHQRVYTFYTWDFMVLTLFIKGTACSFLKGLCSLFTLGTKNVLRRINQGQWINTRDHTRYLR